MRQGVGPRRNPMMSANPGPRDSKVLEILVMEELIETMGKEATGIKRGGRGAARKIPGMWADRGKIYITRVVTPTSAGPREGWSSTRMGAR
jgi:hypothetical protein